MTIQWRRGKGFKGISTHILTKRMTKCVLCNGRIKFKFQLTSSRRGWRDCTNASKCNYYFNSHPHEEDDAAESGSSYFAFIISTHILTKRMTPSGIFHKSAGIFQLTSSRRGWRQFLEKCYCICYISTHILTKRMTAGAFYPIKQFFISTHILTKRMTNPFLSPTYQPSNFNSHPHEEDDCQLHAFFFPQYLFQLTSSRRGWQA